MQIQVRQGDSFWYYATTFNVPLSLIIDSNPTLSPTTLPIGQAVQIPGYRSTSYQIKPGDTLDKIAVSNKIPVDLLHLVNPSTAPTKLQAGQIIRIPTRIMDPIVNGNQNYDFQVLTDHLSQLYELYPFIRRNTIGNSVMGKSLVELQIGRGPKLVHWNASFHANEWITTAIMMEFINEYLLSLTNSEPIRGRLTNPLYDQVTLSIVPMVDPDGVNLVLNGPPEGDFGEEALRINSGHSDFSGWKANIRGVDLNKQYPAKWELEAARKPKKPSPRDFPGNRPLTEPESIAMANLAEKRSFEKVLAFHTQGEVIYWGYEGFEPSRAEEIVDEFSRESSYEPVRFVDSYTGYKDWFIKEWRRPGYTVELGHGVNPLPLNQFKEIYNKSRGIFLASIYM